MRVAVLARRALLRARRLAALGRRRARGRSRPPATRCSTSGSLERDGALAARRRGAGARAGRRAARRRRRCSPSCTARSARTARSRACSSCSTSPTSARACSPRRCAWTRSSSRTCMAAAGVPQVAYAAVREPQWQADPRACARGWPSSGCRVFVKPARLGSSVGIAKVTRRRRARRGARDRVRPRRARDRRGASRTASRSSARCSARPSPRRRCRARSSSRAPTGTTTRRSTRRAGWSCVVPARISDAGGRARCGGWPRETFLRAGCAGPGARRLLRRGRARAPQRAQHDARASPPTSVYPKLWEATGVPFPELCDRLLGYRARALPRRARRPRVLGPRYDRGANSEISEISTRSAPGARLGDPDQVVAVAARRGRGVKRLRLRRRRVPPATLRPSRRCSSGAARRRRRRRSRPASPASGVSIAIERGVDARRGVDVEADAVLAAARAAAVGLGRPGGAGVLVDGEAAPRRRARSSSPAGRSPGPRCA